MRVTLPVLLVGTCAASAWAVDTQNGARVLEDQNCLECHTLGGQGSGHEPNPNAVELGRRLTPTYTPAALASILWNHTPEMWRRTSAQAAASAATESDWQDLFAYLYFFQFAEPPATLQRGKEALEAKHCVGCHSLPDGATAGPGAAVAEWRNIGDPAMLWFDMWSHAARMSSEAAKRRAQWPELNGRDLMDITAYVQTLQKRSRETQVSLPSPDEGGALFRENCGQCHRGSLSLASRLRNKTWMDIGAGMWNHAPRMLAGAALSSTPFSSAALSPDNMRKILAYVWELQYRGPEGNAERGHKAFNERRCIVCHRGPSGAPASPRPGRTFTEFSMVALSWGQGRRMHAQMGEANIAWPYLSPADVSNLVAFLNSLPAEPR